MQLADMGAEVIKVEEPTRGDESRHWAPFWNGISCYYLAANRNKRSIGLNLKRPEAVDVVKRIAERADVLIESYRAGAVDALGLGYEDVKALNPGIVYCSVSGYGRTGPAQNKPGYDLMLQAYGGVMSVTGEPGRQPVRIGYSLVDITCGWIAYAGIMTALFQRVRTGRGQRVEASLLEGQMAASSFHTNQLPGHRSPPGTPGHGPPSAGALPDVCHQRWLPHPGRRQRRPVGAVLQRHPPAGPPQRPPLQDQPTAGGAPRRVDCHPVPHVRRTRQRRLDEAPGRGRRAQFPHQRHTHPG